MCGIIGVIVKGKRLNAGAAYLEQLRNGLDGMHYRGPDHLGAWNDEQVYLGHRRLSIIDLSADGNQPFTYADGRYVIVFNGEIYNYQELKADLAKLGYSFSTQTDTEVIIAAYIHYGHDFCKVLKGMFAMVLYDRQEQKVLFTRDRLGKKPLFIYENDEVLIFSSEIKFFHAFSSIRLEINEDSLLNFLSLQYIPGPQTIYHQVRQLKPAEIFTWDINSGTPASRYYWSMFDFVGNASQAPSIGEIDELLEKSIRYRLVANVDIGLLLSGGIDSSLLACYMHQLAGKKVRAFNVGFSNKTLDESSYARQVAEALDLDLISLNVEDINADNFSQSVYHGDQPLGDSAIIPTYLIAKSIGKHVKVVLSGEGADELFHGYDHYTYEKYYYKLGRVPFAGAEMLLDAVSGLGVSRVNKIRNKLKSINSFKEDPGTSRWTSILSPELGAGYLNGRRQQTDTWEHQFHTFLQQFRQNAGKLESSLMLDLLTWLPDDLLVKTDRMMMACSVEARTPFLDHELVQRILMSSGNFTEPDFQSKNYLRKLLRSKLPASIADLIANRPKQGFETPKVQWMTGCLHEVSSFLFSDTNLAGNPYLDAVKVSRLWKDFKAQVPGTNNRLVWNLLCFLEWYRQHEDKFSFRK